MDGVLPINGGGVQALLDLHLETFAVLPDLAVEE